MKLSDLTEQELATLINDAGLRESTRLRFTEDHDKLAKGSVVEPTWGHYINGDFQLYVKSSRGHGYYMALEDINILELVPDDTKLYTAKRETPKEKPAMIKQEIVDSTGQVINPGDYVVISHYERLVHAKYVKQANNTLFTFRYQHNSSEFRRRILANRKGDYELPESLKIYSGTLDHLMMRKLQGLG